MKTIKLDTSIGNTINSAAEKALNSAIENVANVEFDFNGILCKVNIFSKVEFLIRDYYMAHRMGWKEIGPEYVKEHSEEIQKTFSMKSELAEIKRNSEAQKRCDKETIERKLIESKIENVEILLSDKEGWNAWKANNTDEYGAAVFKYAEVWAKLMQLAIDKGETVSQCSKRTSFELDYMGISGTMYGVSVQILRKCWKYGSELSKQY